MKEKKLLSKYKEKDRYIKVTLGKKKKKGEEDDKGDVGKMEKVSQYLLYWNLSPIKNFDQWIPSFKHWI